MNTAANHLVVVPIVLPLAAAALSLLISERQRDVRVAVSLATTITLILTSATLLLTVSGANAGAGTAIVYQLGNWPAPFGIGEGLHVIEQHGYAAATDHIETLDLLCSGFHNEGAHSPVRAE